MLVDMDGLTFTDHLIGHLAWPVAVSGLVLFILVRRRATVEGLLHRARKLGVGPFTAELDQAEAKAEQAGLAPAPTLSFLEAEAIPLRPAATEGPEPWFRDLSLLAVENPRRAVVEAYRWLTDFLLKASEYLDPERYRYTEGTPAVRRLAAQAVLAPDHAALLTNLSDAAELALHDDDIIDADRAIQYVQLVARLVAAVREGLPEVPESRSVE
jgi:hypothetical protein